MKKLLSVLLLFAFCFPMARGQTTVTFPPGKLASEAYVRAYVDSVLKLAPPIVKLPPIIPVIPPVSGILKPCDAGPEIRSITSVTEQSLVLAFHGSNVFGLDFQILREGATARSGKITPTSSTLAIGYETLSAGTYTLRLSGNTCLGASTREFTIPRWTGGAPPGQVEPPKVIPPADGPSGGRTDQSVQPVLLSRAHPYILDVRITGSSNDWTISDLSAFPIRDGYEFLYLVNNDLIRSEKPLTGYRYRGNAPLRIHKQPIKKGVENLAKWVQDAKPGEWGDPSASYVFPPIADIGGATYYVFQGAWQPQSGQLAWVNPVPVTWQPTNVSTWPAVSPAIQLPANKVYIQTPHTEGQSIAQLLRLGVTHYSHRWKDTEANLPADKTYNDVPQTQQLLQFNYLNGSWVKNITETQARSAGRSVNLPGVWVGETMEGDGWLEPSSLLWGYFYDEVSKRYQASYRLDGKRRYLAHNYFDILPKEYSRFNVGKLTDLRFAYNTPARYLPRGNFGGSLAGTNTHVTGWYKSHPDDRAYVYEKLYAMQVSKRLGLFTGVFIFPVHEYLPGFSWYFEAKNPDGMLSRSDKAPLSPSELITAAFLGLDEGDLAVVWETDFQRSPRTADLVINYTSKNKDIWEPASGSGGPGTFPYKSVSGDGFPYYPQWTYDLFHFGILLYNASSAATEGGESKYAAFRLDGGPWIEPQPDGSDVLDAWTDHRGLVKVTRKGTTATISYLNPSADNQPHSIEIRDPANASRTWQGRVFSDMVHAVNLTL